jgi:drug/metabolite transporter (DMT)-like permease
MLLLLLCILVNASLSVVFKLFTRFSIDNKAAITVNYFICVITGIISFGQYDFFTQFLQQDWILYALGLGFLFVFTFNMVAITVQQHGILVATVFQRMSLLAPALLAILVFNESATWIKWVGILLSLLSIVLLSTVPSQATDRPSLKRPVYLWLIPVIVFLGSCMVDSGLYIINFYNIIKPDDIIFICSLFLFAGIFGLIQLMADKRKLKYHLLKKNILGGIALGIPNFFSIFLLMRVINSGLDASLIFPANNVGILMASAIFGLIFFKEYIKGRRLVGFILATLSIILISNG